MEEEQITASDDAVKDEAVKADAVKTDESGRGGEPPAKSKNGLIKTIFLWAFMGLAAVLTLVLWLNYRQGYVISDGYVSAFIGLGIRGNVVSVIISDVQTMVQAFSAVGNPYNVATALLSAVDAIAAALVGIISLILTIIAVVCAVKKNYAKTVKCFMGILHLVIIDFITSVWCTYATVGVATIVFFAIAFAAILEKIALNFVFNIKNVVKNSSLKDIIVFAIGAALAFVVIVLMMNINTALITATAIAEFIDAMMSFGFDIAYMLWMVFEIIVLVGCIALIVLGIKLAKKRFTQLMDLGDCDAEPAADANKKKSKTPSFVTILVWSAIMFVGVVGAAAYPGFYTGLAVGICAFVFSLGAVIADGLIKKLLPGGKATAEEKTE